MELDPGPGETQEVVRLESRHRQLGVNLAPRAQHVAHVRVADLKETRALVTSTLTAYLTPYTTLVHQGKGTEYPR